MDYSMYIYMLNKIKILSGIMASIGKSCSKMRSMR